MSLSIVGKIINSFVTILTTLVVFELCCTRPMCFVFCQSINNSITLSLTFKIVSSEGLISTTCMICMANE